MKKVLFISILAMLSCFALRAQTTEFGFINTSSSDEIIINIPELFGYDLVLPKDEIVTIKVDNDLITKKDKHEIFVYYPLCGNKEKTYIKIGKVNRIGDIVEPCSEAKIRNCNFPEGKAFVKLTNEIETGEEISILNEPLQGLSLKFGQESQVIAFPIGRNSLTIESFMAPDDHSKGFKKENFNFFAIQDTSCVSKVKIKIREDLVVKNKKEKINVRVKNNTDRNITFGDGGNTAIFEGISLAPGKESLDCEIEEGISPIIINFLDNKGDKKTVIVSKHIVKGDRVIITQKNLEVEAVPRVKNYGNRNRYYRNYYNIKSY